jgi:hypothetical protein
MMAPSSAATSVSVYTQAQSKAEYRHLKNIRLEILKTSINSPTVQMDVGH